MKKKINFNNLISNRKEEIRYTKNIPFKSRFLNSKIQYSFFLIILILMSCGEDDNTSLPENTISYQTDGRTNYYLNVDLNSDGTNDYFIAFAISADTRGDHKYAIINPVGANLIKSGANTENYLFNMGFLVAETYNANINHELQLDQQWANESNILAIRNTNNDASVWYEGNWSNNSSNIVGIQLVLEGKSYFGWLRLKFNKLTETVTLIDYAYEKTANKTIKAGDY